MVINIFLSTYHFLSTIVIGQTGTFYGNRGIDDMSFSKSARSIASILQSWIQYNAADLTSLQEPFLGDDFDEYWGPRERTWSPPGWGEKPVPAVETPPSVDQQKPWATCPDCKEHPEALYIDCRVAHMLRQYNDPVTGAPVPLLPITYPFRSRVATADVLPGEDERKSSLKGAPKLVKSAAVRRLLKRWSGHVPVTKRYIRKTVQIIPGPTPKPLKVAEVEVRLL